MSDKELLMQTRAYLRQISKIDLLIRRLRSGIGEARSVPAGQSSVLRPYRLQTPSEKSRQKDTVVEIVVLEEQVNSRIAELAAMRNEAFVMIGNVPDFEQQNILVARYIQRKDWDDIAGELAFSTKWVLKLHRRGLAAFAAANSDFLEGWRNHGFGQAQEV